MKPAPPVIRIMAGVIRVGAGPRKAPGAMEGQGEMAERPRFFDDLAGVAGGAISALAGLREEIEALARARIDETIRRLDLVKREELDAVAELAANARTGQEAAEAHLHDALERLAALEARVAALEPQKDAE
jgi:BMFP domain-containing protein YqiC